MSILQGVVLALAIVGFGIPAWIFAFGIYLAAKRAPKLDPGVRFAAYVSIVDRLFEEMDKDKNRAAVMLVCIRELREFPQYRDITIALLQIIDVTGNKHQDHMLIEELKATEDALLESKHV